MDVFGLKRRICVVPRPHLSAIGLVEMMLWMIVASFGQVVNQQKGTLGALTDWLSWGGRTL